MAVRLATDDEILGRERRPAVDPTTAVLRGVNTQLANFLDIPGEIVASGLRTLGIVEDIEAGGWRKLGGATGLTREPGEEPFNAMEAGGDFVGMTMPLALNAPAAASMKAADLTVTGLNQGKEILRAFLKEMGESSIRPGPTVVGKFSELMRDMAPMAKFAGMETIAAMFAGIGGHVAQEEYPNSPAAEFVGTMLGGVTPIASLQIIKYGTLMPWIARAARAMTAPFLPTGVATRAQRRVRRATGSPHAAAIEISEADVLPGVLTPAQKTGEPGLLALEKSIIESTPEGMLASNEQIANAVQVIRDSLKNLGGGQPIERTKEVIDQARNYLVSLLETRLKVAAQITENRIAALEPSAGRQQVNEIGQQEVEKALKAAGDTEEGLWDAVGGYASLTETKAIWLATLLGRKLSSAPETLPAWIGELLGRVNKKTGELSKGKLGAGQPVNELVGFDSLRSRLQEEAAIARTAKQYTKARYMDDLADAVLADVSNVPGEAAQFAINFSKAKNDAFRRGPVGKLLGHTRDRGVRTEASLFLEASVGRTGPSGRVNAEALTEAVNFSGIDGGALKGAIEDFILGDFTRMAVRKGTVNQRTAALFLKQYEEILPLYPELKANIETAIKAGESSILAASRLKSVNAGLVNPNTSRAAVFINAPVNREMARIATSQNPSATAEQLIRQARRDPTGKALDGLRTGFSEFLMKKAEGTLPNGDTFISGRALRAALRDPNIKSMMKKFFPTDVQQKRLNTIINTAVRLEMGITARASKEGIIGDAPGALVELVGRIGGAQAGRWIASRTGGGTVQTPGIVASKVRTLMHQGVNDPAQKLLVASINDEKLFRALLIDTSRPQGERFARTQLNAWAATLTGIPFKESGNNP